ncbi:ectonucleotide pyrophosphatase/phosphodiesterase [Thermomonas fusca]|uniref:alkaline phosphatase family protein n=1 Tax=Thermomonas fusca TaxID=215690 RepID=UPI00040FC42A|nr:ectonucleotide pyrophosphatase/phosphodiesterase [Thermomonas fusca]
MRTFFRSGLLAIVLLVSACATRPPSPPVPQPATLLLISVDGLRPTDVTREQMPVLDALANANVRAQGMRPSYPSLTFPNHYTLVTGRRPNQHGIIHNTMEDAGLGEFRLSNREAVGNAGWWQGGTPVWISVQRAGLRAATMFWPGSEAEIDGVRPWRWRSYDGEVSDADRVAQVLEWLRLPTAERPRFITLYFDVVDHVSHDQGPGSAAARAARARVDAALGQLLDGLRAAGQLDATNLVVVSDHGFETVPPGQSIAVEDMAPPGVAQAVSVGQVIGFAPRAGKVAVAERQLLGAHPQYRCWRKGELPAHWHYGSHPRIPAIVCQMAPGWDALFAQARATRLQQAHARGSHGYDPSLPSMRATFIAAGPAFRPGTRLPVFDNVDVYPLLMRLLALQPEDNDGDISPLLPALEPAR